MSSTKMIKPSRLRPDLPLKQVILEREPGDEAVPLDVLFVGGGPAGPAGAIEFARLAREDYSTSGLSQIEIGVLDKAPAVGEHCLSGAALNPGPLRELFPDLEEADFPFHAEVGAEAVFLLTSGSAIRVPTPPIMRNRGNRITSICQVVRRMETKEEELGVNLFRGYPVDESFIMDDLRRTRNMRSSFRSGLFTGTSRACLMMLTGGRFPGRTLRTEDDAEIPSREDLTTAPRPWMWMENSSFGRRMPCSGRGTVPGTTFPLISSLRETCRLMSRSYTPICARRESARARGVAWWSTLSTASTVRLRMCWVRDGPRGRAAADLCTGRCRGSVGRQVGAGSASGKGAPGYEGRVRQA